LTTTGSEPARRGRKTKEQEAWNYLLSQGIDPAEVLGGTGAPLAVDIPDDPSEVVEAFKGALYKQMTRGELKGTALVQGLKAVATLAEAAKNEPDADGGPERGIDEILADAGLPDERRLEIGRGELARLESRTVALARVLETIGEAA
jgi:hypothetical protein